MELQRSDQKLLAKAVSGFANARGGTLIVGIDTKKHEGLDRACAIQEIEDVEQVSSRYEAYIRTGVSPPVEGISVTPVLSSGGRGIIVIVVPQGQARPHMSRAPDQHTYYRRVMDTFVPMEAYEVEEMMRLKAFPELSFVHTFRRAGSTGGNNQFSLLFGLQNISKVTAKFPYVEYLNQAGGPLISDTSVEGSGQPLWQQINAASAGILFAAGADQVLHPDQSLFVGKIDFMERPLEHHYGRGWPISRVEEHEDLRLFFRFGCEDMRQQLASLQFSKDELAAIAGPAG